MLSCFKFQRRPVIFRGAANLSMPHIRLPFRNVGRSPHTHQTTKVTIALAKKNPTTEMMPLRGSFSNSMLPEPNQTEHSFQQTIVDALVNHNKDSENPHIRGFYGNAEILTEYLSNCGVIRLANLTYEPNPDTPLSKTDYGNLMTTFYTLDDVQDNREIPKKEIEKMTISSIRIIEGRETPTDLKHPLYPLLKKLGKMEAGAVSSYLILAQAVRNGADRKLCRSHESGAYQTLAVSGKDMDTCDFVTALIRIVAAHQIGKTNQMAEQIGGSTYEEKDPTKYNKNYIKTISIIAKTATELGTMYAPSIQLNAFRAQNWANNYSQYEKREVQHKNPNRRQTPGYEKYLDELAKCFQSQ